jgi:hypothetical protein
MKPKLFYRNIRGGDNLDIFLISAATSLLLLRFFLSVTGYPSVGGSSLHIAHMLYGGLLMLVSIAMMLSFLGSRIQRVAAVLGGAGFGIFIDEIGKFLTRDNNYFFRPAIGIIYAIFIILYLVFNFLSRDEKLTRREYELNALAQFEEAVLRDMDKLEKARIRMLLEKADQRSLIVQELSGILDRVETVRTPEPWIVRRVLNHLSRWYRHFWDQRGSNKFVGAVFIIEALLFLFAVLASLVHNFTTLDDVFRLQDNYAHFLIVGQLVSSVVAAGFALAGAIQLRNSRPKALELFRRAVLINLFLTEFFIFSRLQLQAIPSFVLNLALLLLVTYSIHEEKRVRA